MQIGLLVLIALATVVAFRLVGVILAVAMLVTPAAAAVLVSRSLSMMMIAAVLIGVFSTVIGLYASFHFDLAAGPSIVLTAVIVLGVLFAASSNGLRSLLRRGSGGQAAETDSAVT